MRCLEAHGEGAAATITKVPEIRPISDLARDARGLIERARQRQEPIVITQRDREAAVLVPIELYRRMESGVVHRFASPRLVNPEDAKHFQVELTVIEASAAGSDAGV